MDFNPRPPCGGRLRISAAASEYHRISIHVPRVEDDIDICPMCVLKFGFQSTSPVWRTTDGYEIAFESSPISIHVPRVEDDTTRSTSSANITNFNPRPPCGGRLRKLDLLRGRGRFQSTSPVWRTTGEHYEAYRQKHRFQSTSPVWRTTQSSRRGRGGGNHFNPRPPCGGRPNPDSRKRSKERFQSTSPVWRTTYRSASFYNYKKFQSTSPVWRTTNIALNPVLFRIYFNPRPPCGGRPNGETKYFVRAVFQSTSPVWRTTRVNIHFITV